MSISGKDAFCIVDEQAKLKYTSDTFNSMFGYSQEEIQGNDIYALVHSDDHSKIKKLLNNGIVSSNDYSSLMSARTKGGEYMQFKTTSSLVRSDELDKRQVLIHFQKIAKNDPTRSENTLSDQKFRILFNNAYDAIFLMKGDEFIDCNPRTEVLFGCSRDELLRRKPYEFSPVTQPDGRNSREKAIEKINKALRGIPQTFEWVHCRRDGIKFDAEVNLNRIDIDGEQMIQAIVRDITRRKETEAELRYRVNFEKFISSISSNFINLSSDEIDGGIQNTLEDVGMFAGIDRSFIFLLDQDKAAYSIAYEWYNDGCTSLLDRQISIKVKDIPWWHEKLERFENFRIADVSILPAKAGGEKQILKSIGSRSFLCVPLRIGKSLIGFLGFDAVIQKEQWSIESVDLLNITGEKIANSLERKRRDAELQRLAAQRKHLLEVSTSMLATLNLDEVISRTLKVLNEIIRFDECGIHLLDRERQVLQPHIIVDSSGNQIESKKSIVPLGEGIISSVVESSESQIVNNAHLDPRSFYPGGKRFDEEHLICVPMHTNNNILGTFSIVRHNYKPFTTDEYELIQLFVGYATVAMENARLYQTVQKQHSITSALLKTALSIVEHKGVNKVLEVIARQAIRISGVDRGAVFLWDESQQQLDPLTIISPREKDSRLIEKQTVQVGDAALIDEILRTQSPIIVGQNGKDDLLPVQFVEEFDIRSMLVIPFFKDGKLLGILTLDDTQDVRLFTQEDINVAIGIANQATVAIENARLFEQIKNSEERYRSLFEDSKDGVFTSSADGRIIDINPAGVEMLGYDSKDELRNVNIGRGIYADSDQREEYKEILYRDGYVRDFETVLKRKDGNIFTCLITSTKFHDEKTGKTYFRGFMRDVTEKKILEEQLRQTQKMESLGQLAGGIAHDFNNVLGILQASLAALRTNIDSQNSDINNYLEMADNAITRGADVARRMLTFSQSNEVSQAPLFIGDVTKDIVNVLKHTIEKNIQVEPRIPGDLPPVLGDYGQIYQMVLNLCLNARDAIVEHTATTEDGIIRILAEPVNADQLPAHIKQPAESRYLKLSIEDNGGGIPEHIRSRIFEPFFTSKGKGTGLGLSVVYGIVQSHNGYLDVQTEPGAGTTISVFLPVTSIEATPVQTEEDLKSINGGNEKIMIIEDEDILRSLMEDVLKSKGYNVTAASDGTAALQLFRKHHTELDAIILDMGLPKLPGQALFLKMMQINPQSKIILASGYVDEVLKSNLFELGAKAFIQKPYKPHEILKSVRNILDEYAEN